MIQSVGFRSNRREQEWLFGTKNRHNIKRDLKKACVKAGVDYYTTHALGRHKAARNFIRSGGSIKGLQDAYRWKDPNMPMRH
jgi:hypothetical protein